MSALWPDHELRVPASPATTAAQEHLESRKSLQGWLLSLSTDGCVYGWHRKRAFTGQDFKRPLDHPVRSFGRGDRCKVREWPLTLRTNWCSRPGTVIWPNVAKPPFQLQRLAGSDAATACFPVNCPTALAPDLSSHSGTGRPVGFVGSVKPVIQPVCDATGLISNAFWESHETVFNGSGCGYPVFFRLNQS